MTPLGCEVLSARPDLGAAERKQVVRYFELGVYLIKLPGRFKEASPTTPFQGLFPLGSELGSGSSAHVVSVARTMQAPHPPQSRPGVKAEG